MLRIARLSADLCAALVFGADLVRHSPAVGVRLARAAKFAQAAGLPRHSAAIALIGLARADLVVRDAGTVLRVSLKARAGAGSTGRARERQARKARRATAVARAIRRAVGIGVVGSGADAEKIIGRVAVARARGATRVKLTRLLGAGRIAKEPLVVLAIERALAASVALAIEVRLASDLASPRDASSARVAGAVRAVGAELAGCCGAAVCCRAARRRGASARGRVVLTIGTQALAARTASKRGEEQEQCRKGGPACRSRLCPGLPGRGREAGNHSRKCRALDGAVHGATVPDSTRFSSNESQSRKP